MDLRELRIDCLRKLGLLSNAAAEAESLAGEDPSTTNIANLVNILVSKLDTHGAAAVAQKLLGRSDLTADIALNVAGLLQSESPELARELWRQAVATSFEDKLITLAYKLGSQLGFTTELQPLIKRIAEAADGGDAGIAQKATLDDFLKMIEEERKRFQNFDRLYRCAEIPLQLMADTQNIPLIYPYHQGLADMAVSPEDRRMLLARWGGRPQVTIFPEKIQEIRLYADVSSLLMANHLDILDTIESQLGPIHIAPATAESLLSIRDQLIPLQPSRINAIRNVIDLISKKNIITDNNSPASLLEAISNECVKARGPVWARQVSRALLEDGFVLDLSGFQYRANGLMIPLLPEEIRSRFVTCGIVARSLAELGFIPNDQLENVLFKLGSEGVLHPNDRLLNQHTRIYIQPDTAIAMAEVEILDPACLAFRFHVDLDDYQNLVHELQQSDQRSILRGWVESLLERLRRGIDQGRYLIQSIPPAPKRIGEWSLGPSGTSLDQLLRTNRQPGDVLWIDDRAIGRQLSQGPISVVCTSDLLRSAFHYGVIDASQYYQYLIRLRREGVYFIPADSAELLYHMDNATIRDGEILETEELYTLRKYFAQAFESKVLLFTRNKSTGEEQFAFTLLVAVDESLVSIWKSDRSFEGKRALSRWLWCSFGLHEVPGLRGETKPSPEALAIRLASLLGRALAFGVNEKNIAQRNEYLAWLENYLIAPRLAADSAFAQTISGLLKRGPLSLLLKKDNAESKEEHGAIRAVTSDFIDALPQSIALEVNRDQFLMRALGRRLRTAVSIRGWKFPSPEIWHAASGAISEGRSEAETLDGKPVSIEASISSETNITLRFGSSKDHFEVADPLNGMLLSSVDLRRHTLQMIRSTFDVNDSTFASRSAEISLIEKCDERMNAALSWLHESTSTYYQQLEDRIQADPKFRWSDILPPPTASMLGRYRLEKSGIELAENFQRAAEILLKEVGFDLALERFAALPICLPDPIIRTLHAMNATERRAALLRFAQASGSPVACFHTLRLLLNEPEDVEIKQVIKECLDYLAHDGTASCNAFLTLLQFAFEELSIRRDANDLTISIRLTLAWAHAHELFTIFQKHGISNDWIIGLRNLRPPIPFEVFGRNPEVFQDIAYPRALHPEALLLFGLAYAIEEAPPSTLSQIQERDFSERFTRVMNSGEMKAPTLTLLQNRHLGRNSLTSFLVWRPAIENILGADVAAFIKPDILKEHARNVLNKLSENSADLEAWAILSCIVGEFDPGDDLREPLKNLIQNADFSLQVLNTAMIGRVMIALNFLCQQRAYSRNMESIDLKPHIMRIAERINHLDQKTAHHYKADFELGLFLEACVLSTTIPGDHVSSARGFAQLTSEVVRMCPGIAQLARNVFQRLCDGLPVSQSQELWGVLTHLRTLH
jgi:hypothetical protein